MKHQGPFDEVVSDVGVGRFCGVLRDDVPPEVFSVKIAEENGTRYGEFKIKFEIDRVRYRIIVISFGYYSKDLVGHPAKINRETFAIKSEEKINSVIFALFNKPGERPFPLKKAENFTGKIEFCDDWILKA